MKMNSQRTVYANPLEPVYAVTEVGSVRRYFRELGMPPLTMQEEDLTKKTSCASHCPSSGAS